MNPSHKMIRSVHKNPNEIKRVICATPFIKEKEDLSNINVKIIKKMENKDNGFKGWLLSDSLIKRSLAIVGHYLIGQIIIAVVIAVPLVLFTMLFRWIF